MKVEKDYEDFLKLLNKNNVKYCIIGSFALAFHAKPRYTKVMDILIEPSVKNAERVINALKEFGFESLGLVKKDFMKRDQVIQLCYEPVRIDILTSIAGCSFDEVWENIDISQYGKTEVNFISKSDLIKNKKAVGRKQDLADLDILQE